MKRKLSLLLLAALATFALCAPLSLAQEAPRNPHLVPNAGRKSFRLHAKHGTIAPPGSSSKRNSTSILYGSIPRPAKNRSNST